MTLDNNGLDGSRIIDPDARELADLLVQAAAGRNVETEILQFLGSGPSAWVSTDQNSYVRPFTDTWYGSELKMTWRHG